MNPPGNGRPDGEDAPGRFLRPCEPASCTAFEVAEWTDAEPPR